MPTPSEQLNAATRRLRASREALKQAAAESGAGGGDQAIERPAQVATSPPAPSPAGGRS